MDAAAFVKDSIGMTIKQCHFTFTNTLDLISMNQLKTEFSKHHGIVNIRIDADCIDIEYDLIQISYEEIEISLQRLAALQPITGMKVILQSLKSIIETNACEHYRTPAGWTHRLQQLYLASTDMESLI